MMLFACSNPFGEDDGDNAVASGPIRMNVAAGRLVRVETEGLQPAGPDTSGLTVCDARSETSMAWQAEGSGGVVRASLVFSLGDSVVIRQIRHRAPETSGVLAGDLVSWEGGSLVPKSGLWVVSECELLTDELTLTVNGTVSGGGRIGIAEIELVADVEPVESSQLEVTTRPVTSSVYIGGQARGATPILLDFAEPGVKQLTLYPAGGNHQVREVACSVFGVRSSVVIDLVAGPSVEMTVVAHRVSETNEVGADWNFSFVPGAFFQSLQITAPGGGYWSYSPQVFVGEGVQYSFRGISSEAIPTGVYSIHVTARIPDAQGAVVTLEESLAL